MEKIKFFKYHGTGNDFIMIDNRSGTVKFESASTISGLCHRRFGIGADGLILLENSDSADFKMIYYNSDGLEGSMCGNGGRCIVAFAEMLGIISGAATFDAIDGKHYAEIHSVNGEKIVSLNMNDVSEVQKVNDDFVLDTGSPHYVIFCDNTDTVDVIAEGKKIRYSNQYTSEGINVNFVAAKGDDFTIRTYERGVEDETYSCGTGTVAAAIALEIAGKTNGNGIVRMQSPGGWLEVSFTRKENIFSSIRLTGPATRSYEGNIELN